MYGQSTEARGPEPEARQFAVGGNEQQAKPRSQILGGDPDGSTAGSDVQTLNSGERVSALADQLVPASAGQSGGYIRIRSNKPVIGQMLFGALQGSSIRLFSAVQPTRIR